MLSNIFLNKRDKSNCHLVLGSLVVSFFFVIFLCSFLEPRWESNDDVGMSMVAHGYGIAAFGSPHLIFSNVIWGYLVRCLPEFNGILGYSIATIAVLISCGAVLVYGLLSFGLGYVSAFLVPFLALARPVLFPQFTINAGLLMVSFVICLHLYKQKNDKRIVFIGCLLAYCSYLVRNQEFFLVLAVSLPLLPFSSIRSDKWLKISLATTALIVIASHAVDKNSYRGEEWAAFNKLNPPRALFTDFGAHNYIKQRPDILERYGYSVNDINLTSNWFFADPNITDPDKLNAMLKELGPLPAQQGAVERAFVGMKILLHPSLLPILLAAGMIAFFCRSWQVAASWSLCIAAIFVLGLLGRPGVVRVYVPLVSLLLIAPFLIENSQRWIQKNWYRQFVIHAILVAAAIFNTSIVFSASKTSQKEIKQISKELTGFPSYPVINWGAAFPFENAYPVLLRNTDAALSYQLYGLGAFTLAPFSVSSLEQKSGRGVVDLLKSKKEISIIASMNSLNLLDIYCKERLHCQLTNIATQQYGTIQIHKYRCEDI
ncbi:MAG: hypothetical protein CDV28_14217 [Candidatus Electronema aureum]|uniref:Dolichyl-phosphate-mannose-protein mannosyltransferase n=1 Tax=Candidatus Electronema aureum TaxID=2005002 RepID=A0A521FZ47_9BACT|nr:MAG: hypothetical protein CDV28_14217 [Candidatus Electronema aureum]